MNTKRNYFDIFISYDPALKKSVVDLVNILKRTFVLWFDIDEISNVDDNVERATKIINGLKNSKALLCFITLEYKNSNACNKEISLGHAYKKPIIALMVENLSVESLNVLAYFLVDAPVIRAYEVADFFKSFHGPCFDELIYLLTYIKENSRVPIDSPTLAIQSNRVKHESVSSVQNILGSSTEFSYKDKNFLIEPVPSKFNCSNICEYFRRIFCDRQSSPENVEMDVPYDQSESRPGAHQNILDEPEPLETRRIKSTLAFELPSDHLRRVARLHNKKQLLICDVKNKSIITIDLNGKVLSSVNPGSVLKGPSAICVDSNDKIYVSDYVADHIFVFNENMKLIRQLDRMIQVDTAFDLAMDNDKQCIYASDTNNHVLQMINRFNGHLLRTHNIQYPKDLFIFGQFLYVLSDLPMEPHILVLDKMTFKEVHSIRLTNLNFIRGLHVDQDRSVYVSAYESDKNGNVDWNSAFLYIFNSSGVLSHRLKLNLSGLWDFLIVENRVYFIREKEKIHFIVEL
jgi:hypothetical protein